jgi:histidinol dehydrogenase
VNDELDQILISASQPDFADKLDELHNKLREEARFGGFDKESEKNRQKVLDIIRDIFKRKYEAVRKYTNDFDGEDVTPERFQVSRKQLQQAHSKIDKSILKTIRQAIKNVRKYQKEIFTGNDKKCSGGTGIKYTPIKRVGICVPGASAPLLSTVIMCAVPAQVAGVKEIVVVSPPRHKGDIHPVTLAVCCELGIDEVYRVGGAQAVAALSTDEVVTGFKKVDKIVGPGNKWVQTAKLINFGYVGIDSIAGPSEVLIIANEKANPAWVAADMLSQAEHAPGSAVVYTDSQDFAQKTLEELKKQVGQLSRKEATIECLLKFGAIVVFVNMEDVIERANNIAAEHLEIHCGDKSRQIAERIKNAGAIFIGEYSPVAVGDYWAGPSHTLPTGTTARFASALSANDFVKSTSIIEYDKKMLAKSAADIIRLAECEGLDAHARSVKIRQT